MQILQSQSIICVPQSKSIATILSLTPCLIRIANRDLYIAIFIESAEQLITFKITSGKTWFVICSCASYAALHQR